MRRQMVTTRYNKCPSRATTAKKGTKKRDARAECIILFFCCSCCRRSRRCLSSLLSRLDRVDLAGRTKLLIDLTC